VRVLEQVQHIAPPVQAAGNFSAIGAAMASFFGMIQGPLAVIASFLSICWLGLQIFSWLERRRKGKF
jgi:hypothetical protein